MWVCNEKEYSHTQYVNFNFYHIQVCGFVMKRSIHTLNMSISIFITSTRKTKNCLHMVKTIFVSMSKSVNHFKLC